MDTETVGVVGAGVIGAGVAQALAEMPTMSGASGITTWTGRDES